MALDGKQGGYDIGSEARVREEQPAVVLANVLSRRRPPAHIVTFANEKGGVGKSTFAFHCAVALAHRAMKVLVIDCDRRQQSLHRFLEARDGTARALKIPLPRPHHLVLEKQSGALLLQEIERAGRDWDYILIDLAGQDSPIARRAIALADTLVTPINCSPTDLDALGRINPVSRHFRHAGPFADVVAELRAERLSRGLTGFDWVVAKNRVRHCEHRLLASIDANLATISRHLGFRTVEGLTERVAYRELLPFGLTQLDLRYIHDLGAARATNLREMRDMIESLQLPCFDARRPVTTLGKLCAPVRERTAQNYREAMSASIAMRAG